MAPEIESDACASNSFTSDESEEYVLIPPVLLHIFNHRLLLNSEFEVPEGFHSIKASKSLLHEDIHSDDKELWLFKLPKNVRNHLNLLFVSCITNFLLDERFLAIKSIDTFGQTFSINRPRGCNHTAQRRIVYRSYRAQRAL